MKYRKHTSRDEWIVTDSNKTFYAQTIVEEDAALIVLSINHFDAMEKALRELVAAEASRPIITHADMKQARAVIAAIDKERNANAK